MNSYEQKQEERRQRYLDRAEKAMDKHDSLHEKSREMMSIIPMGQPIHSTADRNYREKAWNKVGQAVRERDKSEYYESKADSVGCGGISSDDPEAVRKVKDELTTLESDREHMKRINREYKKVKDLNKIDAPDHLKKKGLSILTHQAYYGKPFPPYALQNLGANIRRYKKRLDSMQREAGKEEREPIKGNGWKIVDCKEDNRIRVYFDGKPPKEVCKVMRSNGFVFSRQNMAWQRQLNGNGRWAAQNATAQIDNGNMLD
jgi:hypothetical protein